MEETIAVGIPELLDKKSKHDYAYRKLKEWIIQGVLPPDTILVERQLCEMLGLSRTPIRSALQELSKDGFVLNAPGRGMMVTRVQIEDVIEIFEIRRSLDILALELFMKNDHPDIVVQMRRTVEQMREALDQDDYQAFIHADNQFHELYSHNSGNRRLEGIWSDLQEQERSKVQTLPPLFKICLHSAPFQNGISMRQCVSPAVLSYCILLLSVPEGRTACNQGGLM